MFTLSIDVTFDTLLDDMAYRAESLEPVWPEVTPIVKAAVDQNFDEQGTPQSGKWPPSLRAIRDGGLTLVDTGALRRNACNYDEAYPKRLVISTVWPYAVDVTTGKGVIPPRPFQEVGQETAVQVGGRALVWIAQGR